MREANQELEGLTDHIDLMVMNIEGYEFQLVPHLLKPRPGLNIERMAVQFHPRNSNVADYYYCVWLLNNRYRCSFQAALPSWGYWYE